MTSSAILGSNDKVQDLSKLVNWKNPPTLENLKQDLESANIAHQAHVMEVDSWLRILNAEQVINCKPGRSKLVPKLVRKQAEWRYAALSEPFLSTDDLFKTAPATFEDKETAEQNGMVLNYQLNSRLDKVAFIDEYIRTAVDEGSVIVRVDWDYEENERTVIEDILEDQPSISPDGQIVIQQIKVGERSVQKKIVTKNQPVLTVCDYNNVVIDPTANGIIDKAQFIIYSFETSRAELKKDSRYKNIDDINFDSVSVLNEPDYKVQSDDISFTFKDNTRKKIIAREYWGFWDIHDNGTVEPFIATWVGSTIIRMELNPYPDKKLPFIIVQYLPRRKNNYGEPDAALIEDNQRIVGAITRGIIDTVGRSANGQQGIRKDALDVTNARKYERGEDYKFNANIDPSQAFHMDTYPEISSSAINILNMQNNDAESLTGVKSFTNGISGQALGVTATGIRSALDATSKRELGILRRLSNGLNQIGRKVISMNAEFLEDEEIIRITNDELRRIDRNDLGGNYDIKLSISTAEADEQKASELSFMLQTMGNNMDAEMSKLILSDIAKLRKMPELAKRIEEHKPQPDPLVQEEQQLKIELLKAQIANELAKGQENQVDVQLKSAKTITEQAKARNMGSDADLKDLQFVEQESGVDDARRDKAQTQKHMQDIEKQEHKRLSELDKIALNGLNSNNSSQ